MAGLRPSEMWYGRPADPADYVDSAAAPVMYSRHSNHGPAAPSFYDAPPIPVYDYETATPYPPPSHFLPPYEYVKGPEPPARAPPPAHAPPEDMVIPGVLHPDGHFEPHPDFARRSPPGPPPETPEKHGEPEEPSKHVTELAVPVCCEACRERVTNYMEAAEGVDEVECDVDAQKVKVIGDIAPADALQRCKKCFRKSTLI